MKPAHTPGGKIGGIINDMKPLTVTIRPVRSFDRAIGWYAEIDAPDHTGRKDHIFHRSSRRQVEKLVTRLLGATVERKGW